MKAFISVLLGSSLLLNGCMSYQSLREDAAKDATAEVWPAADENIKITLKDGSTIEAERYHHLCLEKPTDVLSGDGIRFEKGTGKMSIYDRWIPSDSIKSMGTLNQERGRYFYCTLVNGSVIRYNEGAYKLDTLNHKGFWCEGSLIAKGDRSHFIGSIPVEEIQEIEVAKFSAVKTTALVVGVVGLVVLVAVAVTFRDFMGGDWGQVKWPTNYYSHPW